MLISYFHMFHVDYLIVTNQDIHLVNVTKGCLKSKHWVETWIEQWTWTLEQICCWMLSSWYTLELHYNIDIGGP